MPLTLVRPAVPERAQVLVVAAVVLLLRSVRRDDAILDLAGLTALLVAGAPAAAYGAGAG